MKSGAALGSTSPFASGGDIVPRDAPKPHADEAKRSTARPTAMVTARAMVRKISATGAALLGRGHAVRPAAERIQVIPKRTAAPPSTALGVPDGRELVPQRPRVVVLDVIHHVALPDVDRAERVVEPD